MTALHTPAADQLLTAGSTLPLDCRPTVGVVPGAEWTTLAVRVGDKVLDGSVVGRTVACKGACAPTDPEAEEWVWAAILGRLEEAMRRHDTAARRWLNTHGIAVPEGISPFRIAIRRVAQPARVSPEGSANLVESAKNYAWLRCAYPAARPVGWFRVEDVHRRPHGTDVKKDFFPEELIGRRRPARWLAHDGQDLAKGERTGEQAAYHTAGLACLHEEGM
jgi:hypothetical protein